MRFKTALAKSAVAAIVLAMPLSNVMAYADDSNSSSNSFQTKYQQNATLEAQLLQQAKASSVTSVQIQILSSRVDALNQQIAKLYASEQTLLQQIGTGSQSGGDNQGDDENDNEDHQGDQQDGSSKHINDLMNKRNQILQKINQLWNQIHTVQQNQGNGQQGNGDSEHGKGHSKGHGKGHDEDHGQGKVNVQPMLNQIKNFMKQIQNYEQQMAKAKQQGATKVDKEQAEQLEKLQEGILRLQKQAIAYIQLWIKLESIQYPNPNPNPNPNPIAGISVTPNGTVVNEGGTLTYVVQLNDASGHPVKQAGVKLDLSLVSPHNDGALSASTVVTDGNGSATFNVIAGNIVGDVEVVVQVDGSSTIPTALSPITRVTDTNSLATHLVLTSGTFPTSLVAGMATGGSGFVATPENNLNQPVQGDTLQVTTSNSAVLSLAAPDVVGGNTQTVAAGVYGLPVITAKGLGTATITITDISAATHPSLSYTISVSPNIAPIGLVSINPNGTRNTPYPIVNAGLAGPFTIAVVDGNGNIVPATSDITLTAAQVNQLIGAGTGIRVSPSGADLTSITIPAGQSIVSVYADGVSAGNTAPGTIGLANLVPAPTSISVKDAHSITITYSQQLDATSVPAPNSFNVVWGTQTSVPQSVAISGNTVTLTLASTQTISHGDAVNVSYAAGDHPLKSAWGTAALNLNNVTVVNGL